jgi:hypothetical protein
MGQGLPHEESNINGGRINNNTQQRIEKQNRFIFDGSSAVVDEQKSLRFERNMEENLC